MYTECKQNILFQMDIEKNSKFSTPKIKIRKGYPCEITMRTLVHILAHRSHSVSKLNLSFVRLAQCSLSLQRFRTADRTQDPQYIEYMKYLSLYGQVFPAQKEHASVDLGYFFPTSYSTLPQFNIPCSCGAVYLRNNNEAKAKHMGPSPSRDEQ